MSERYVTSKTELQEDPMFLDIFLKLQLRGLSPYSCSNKFSITAEGFIPLVERTYSYLVSFDKNFGKHVSQSMFVYYCCEHFYSRCIFIKICNGENTSKEEEFFQELLLNKYPIPKIIADYINSIGNIRDPRKLKYSITFPAWPNATLFENNVLSGTFGKISAQNHWKYECMPCPLITAMRIQKDLLYTINQGNQNIWDIPEHLRPKSSSNKFDDDLNLSDPGFPTKNLLGWAPSVLLTLEQRILLEKVGISVENFDATNYQFYHNHRLFEIVADYLRLIKNKFCMGYVNYDSENGSLCQIMFVERDDKLPEIFSRTVPYCENKIRSGTAFNVLSVFSLGALICSFRVKKKPIQNIHSYVCYDWQNYRQVPSSWITNSNYIFNFGKTSFWNQAELYTVFTTKSDYRLHWIEHELLQS